MLKSMVASTLFVSLSMFATAFAGADPADPDPFNPADCIGNANAVCNVGPYGPNSMSNPANPASPLNPNNPANPASPLNPNNPANPASPMNPMNRPGQI
ncbi:Uncharacterised protein [Mycolicibacterium phlei]|uniref:hypothetical protein n=1 Tax=Mycobacteroides chelonae TaxID=1774 RepID=UPI000618A033|nr:hypothetical protein [Mycobacteroides chelonae]AKC40819.1 hypothetical protein GR01_22630 [Mycobacteroides chelonae]OLT81745.1 hypothetical protein BKG56_06145 [Mycobacteroides chelonae]ORV14436.1 hypothetical protein AWB96_13740 [Mycobacteroides chelonae]VEG20499.1 Uncharacterised protein [Mycolicibacterium phlei]